MFSQATRTTIVKNKTVKIC
uniref:Uncharacterized protein n=1 Tax=Anguilla anguilla TaxID=7936 RepID=A0A0E9T9J5_ANGAN